MRDHEQAWQHVASPRAEVDSAGAGAGKRTRTQDLRAPQGADPAPRGHGPIQLPEGLRAGRISEGGLDGATRGHMEAAFGADLSSVRVHHGGRASELGALAVAHGEDIHFAPGQYDPGSASGRELIGHEVAHVMQQRAGRTASAQCKGGVAVDAGLEAEADLLGARAARGERVTEYAGAAPGGVAVAQAKFATGHGYRAQVNTLQIFHPGKNKWEALPPNFDLECLGDAVDSKDIPGNPDPGQQLYPMLSRSGDKGYIKQADADTFANWDLADRPKTGMSKIPKPTSSEVNRAGQKHAHVEASLTDWDGGNSRMVGFGTPAIDSKTHAQQNWRTEVEWGPLVQGAIQPEGSSMKAKKLGPDHPLGVKTDLHTGVNASNLATLTTETWVAGHMLNDHLGGTGSDDRNLIAFPKTINGKHVNEVEDAIKTAVNNQGKWVSYSLVVTGWHPLTDAQRKTIGAPKGAQHPSGFTTEWYELDSAGGQGGVKHQHTFSIPKIAEMDAKKLDASYQWCKDSTPTEDEIKLDPKKGGSGTCTFSPIAEGSPYGRPFGAAQEYLDGIPKEFPLPANVQSDVQVTSKSEVLLKTKSNLQAVKDGKKLAEIEKKKTSDDMSSETTQLVIGSKEQEMYEAKLGSDKRKGAADRLPSKEMMEVLEQSKNRKKAAVWDRFGQPLDYQEFVVVLDGVSKHKNRPAMKDDEWLDVLTEQFETDGRDAVSFLMDEVTAVLDADMVDIWRTFGRRLDAIRPALAKVESEIAPMTAPKVWGQQVADLYRKKKKATAPLTWITNIIKKWQKEAPSSDFFVFLPSA